MSGWGEFVIMVTVHFTEGFSLEPVTLYTALISSSPSPSLSLFLSFSLYISSLSHSLILSHSLSLSLSLSLSHLHDVNFTGAIDRYHQLRLWSADGSPASLKKPLGALPIVSLPLFLPPSLSLCGCVCVFVC